MTAVLIVGALGWLLLAVLLGLLLGGVVRWADARDRRDPLADQPAEVLAPTHITDRFTQITGGTP